MKLNLSHYITDPSVICFTTNKEHGVVAHTDTGKKKARELPQASGLPGLCSETLSEKKNVYTHTYVKRISYNKR